ncbi:hypothetical protein [Halorussus ruber]|uniref:hypothetical protein n=1 Tax=Halorussus ruber TaxID=1126238 RepID=UPI001091E5A6|nr:hypothetical protein [Halorussus ruber]
MLDTVLEGVSEEVLGTITGLPPGTVTLASTLLAKTADDSSSAARKPVKRNTSGVSGMEEKILKQATANLAVTCQRDHPRASRRRCTKFAIKTLLAANKMYSSRSMKKVFRDALSRRHGDRRHVMKTVVRDFKKAKRRNRL